MGMDNYTVTVNTMVVWTLWIGGLGIILFDIGFMPDSDDVGFLGMASIAGGVSRHVCCQMQRLDKRARNAFTLGRDSVLSSVRSATHR